MLAWDISEHRYLSWPLPWYPCKNPAADTMHGHPAAIPTRLLSSLVMWEVNASDLGKSRPLCQPPGKAVTNLNQLWQSCSLLPATGLRWPSAPVPDNKTCVSHCATVMPERRQTHAPAPFCLKHWCMTQCPVTKGTPVWGLSIQVKNNQTSPG